MSDGSWEVQQAVYAVLSGLNPPLVENGVHAPAPQDHPLDYIEIGESDALPYDVVGSDGLDERLTLHVWTRPGSHKPAKEIMARIRYALHGRSLSVPGHSALATITSTRLFLDEGGEALHGVVTVRLVHRATI